MFPAQWFSIPSLPHAIRLVGSSSCPADSTLTYLPLALPPSTNTLQTAMGATSLSHIQATECVLVSGDSGYGIQGSEKKQDEECSTLN